MTRAILIKKKAKGNENTPIQDRFHLVVNFTSTGRISYFYFPRYYPLAIKIVIFTND